MMESIVAATVKIEGAEEATRQIITLAASVNDLAEFVRVECLVEKCVNHGGNRTCGKKKISIRSGEAVCMSFGIELPCNEIVNEGSQNTD